MVKREVKWEDLSGDEQRAINNLGFNRRMDRRKWLPYEEFHDSENFYKGLDERSKDYDRQTANPEHTTPGLKGSYNIQLNMQYLEQKGLVKSKLIKIDPHQLHGKRGTVEKAYSLTMQGSKLEREEYERQQQAMKTHRVSLASRVAASIFLLAGFIFMAVPNPTTTGNAVGFGSPVDISLFLSLGLMVIGGVLLFKNLRK